jgi:hypothetical protein
MRKIYQWPQAIPNGHKLHQMVIKYTNSFHSQALQNLPKFEIFGFKINHLATLVAKFNRSVAVNLP